MGWDHTWTFRGTAADIETAIQKVIAEYPGVRRDEDDEWDDEAEADAGISVTFVIPAGVAAEMLQRSSLRFGDHEPFLVAIHFGIDEDGGSMWIDQGEDLDLELAQAFAQKLGASYQEL